MYPGKNVRQGLVVAAGIAALTRKFEQKIPDHLVNSVNDGKRERRFGKGSLEIFSNVDKRYLGKSRYGKKGKDSGNTVKMDMSGPS